MFKNDGMLAWCMDLEAALTLKPGEKVFFNDILIFNIYDGRGQFMEDGEQFSAYRFHKRDGTPLTIRRLIYGSMYYKPPDGRLFLPKEEMPAGVEITAVLVKINRFGERYFHHFDLVRT